MNIIEKNCPSCGANVKFDESAKKVFCEYCKKEFLIEKNDESEYLLTIQEGHRNLVLALVISFVVIIVPLIFLLFYVTNELESRNRFDFANSKYKNYISTVEDIPDGDYYTIDALSRIAIKENLKNNVDFQLKDDLKRQTIYLLNKREGEGNILVSVYKGIYSNNEITYTVYTPVLFKNVKFDIINSVTGFLGAAEVKGDNIYFNLEHSEYTLGYNTLEELYNGIVKPLENNYKVS